MNNVEKVNAGELAIFNDNKEATIKCVAHCWPKDPQDTTGGNAFYFQQKKYGEKWDCASGTALPTIPATVLLSEIEGKTQLTKEEAVRQIKARELAIYIDNLEAAEKCRQVIWPNDYPLTNFDTITIGKFFYKYDFTSTWISNEDLSLFKSEQSIPATELLKLLESETTWSPKVGEMVECSESGGNWTEWKYFGVGTTKEPYIVENEKGQLISFPLCRPLTKQLTRTEAEALLSELKGETYKIVD